MSADSIVPNPSDPQAFNRYSYVRNNPLRYTDPTGHSWISKGFRRVINSINKAIDGVLNKLNIEVSDTEVRASYNSNGVTTVSTPSGSVSSGGSAPQTQTERSSSVCSGGTCVGSSSGNYIIYTEPTTMIDARWGGGMLVADASGRIGASNKPNSEDLEWSDFYKRLRKRAVGGVVSQFIEPVVDKYLPEPSALRGMSRVAGGVGDITAGTSIISLGYALIVNYEGAPWTQMVGAKVVSFGMLNVGLGSGGALGGYSEFQRFGGLAGAKNEILELYRRYGIQ